MRDHALQRIGNMSGQIRDDARLGAVAGLVSGISTAGSVAGTLVSAFVLIPAIGSRRITLVFTVLLAVCAVGLFLIARPPRR